MGAKSSIEWTDATWNPTRGCSMAKGSENGGCLNCYAARFNARNLTNMRSPTTGKPFAILRPSGPRWTGDVELIEKALDLPLKWRSPKRIFVDSQSDLFHEALPDEAIDRVFAGMACCRQHTFQILTKRPERMLKWAARSFLAGDIRIQLNEMEDRLEARGGVCEFGRQQIDKYWPLPNVWLGVSIENQATADARIPLLLKTPAALRFISYEPALGPIGLANLFPSAHGMRNDEFWVIIGGESGPGARPFNLRWAISVIKQCAEAGVPCFVKQLGSRPGIPSCASFDCTHPDCGVDWLRLKDLKGGDWNEWPEYLRVRQFPEAVHVS